MKTLRMKYTVLFLLVLAFFTACSSDSAAPDNSGGEAAKGNLTVHMTLSTSAPATSRAITPTWEDGTEAENMKSWVVAFVQDGKVVSFAEKTSVSTSNRMKDEVTIQNLSAGTYQVYSFANLTATELGISKNASVDFDTKTWKMAGNGFDVNATDSKGIPMSNKQEVTVNADGTTSVSTLWVVRMLAKVTLKFKNPTSTALTIHDVTISDITQNTSSDEANIMLLPKHTDADKDEVACEPNLATTAQTGNYTYAPSTAVTVEANTSTATTDVSFYVNESAAGNTSKYFIVNLNTSSGVKRYALFKDWTTIARNDHHILPITLDDYKLNFKVEAFSAIGMYPSLTDNGTTLSYTCYYPEEEFHIQPTVVSASTGAAVSDIDNTKITWELITEDGMENATAAQANALKVFKTLPVWNPTTGYFEGTFNDDKADKQSALYKVTVPVNDTKSLVYKLLFTKDLRSFAARKHYTRKYYRYE